jgi:hypothetical protein
MAAAVDEERRRARSSVGVPILGHPIDEMAAQILDESVHLQPEIGSMRMSRPAANC